MNKKIVLIAGGSGLVGSHLKKWLVSSGFDVRILSRRPSDSENNIYNWDPFSGTIDDQAFDNVSILINLSGAGIADQPWTPWRKRELINSRVFSTKFLVKILNETDHSVETFISSSATGIYGNTGLEIVHEEHQAADNFLAKTCTRWEQEANKLENTAVRKVIIRISNVLAHDGGIIPTLISTFKFRLAPIFGSGQQYFSWIHIDDLCNLFLCSITDNKFNGVYNASAPGFLSYKNLVILLKQIFKGYYLTFKIPTSILRITLGGMSQLLTDGSRVSSEKAQDLGFNFKYPTAGKALNKILSQ